MKKSGEAFLGTGSYKNYPEVTHGPREIIEEERPYDFINLALKNIKEIDSPKRALQLLDAGCGQAYKLVEIANRYPKKINFTGMDITFPLMKSGQEKASLTTQPVKINFVQADILKKYPFKANSFDIVTHMLSPHHAEEDFRVLRPGGRIVLEKIGEQDKRNLKEEFGKNEEGEPRGYLVNYQPGELRKIYTEDLEKAGFKILESFDGIWTTYYSLEEFKRIINHTKTILNYDEEKDEQIMKRIVEKHEDKKRKMIKTKQHRIVIVAQKPFK